MKDVSEKSAPTITASMFFKYIACPHWLWFDAYGDQAKKKQLSDFQQRLLEQGLEHERDVIADGEYEEVDKELSRDERVARTLQLMRDGVARIYHGVLAHGDMVGEPDVLERSDDAASDLGTYHYVPVEIKSAQKLTDAHKFQLAFYAELLEHAQGRRPRFAYVLNKHRARIGLEIATVQAEYHDMLSRVRRIVQGERPAPHVSSGCKQSPWFKECIALAEETNDIALLYNVKKRVMEALRSRGIRTVDDAAAMDTDELEDAAAGLRHKTLERIKLQARSLADRTHHIRSRYGFPAPALEIFFDIEGDPMRQVEYLFGFLIREGGREEYKPIVAESPEKEQDMWRAFLDWTAQLPQDYAVYHYGAYEKSRLSSMAEQYGSSAALERFRDRLIDLNEIVKDHVVFPLYFYSIKDIGTYIGYKRKGEIASGGDSISYYERWLEEGDRAALDEVIDYNKDDVVATRYLKDWLEGEMKADELEK